MPAIAKRRALAPSHDFRCTIGGGMKGSTMRRPAFLAVIGAIMGIASMSPAAVAQTQPSACTHAPTILDAGDFLLAEPATFPNFWRDRFGDDAAYLKIRYGDLTYAEGSALLASLEKRSHPPLRIVELRLAYAKTQDRAAMIAGMQPPAGSNSIVSQLGASAWRALVTEDGGDWLLGELAAWQTSDPYQASVAAKGVARTLSDLDEEAKSRLAQRAEDAGIRPLALGVRAAKDDLADYVAYLDRLPAAARQGHTHAVDTRCALHRRFSPFLRHLQAACRDPGVRPQERHGSGSPADRATYCLCSASRDAAVDREL